MAAPDLARALAQPGRLCLNPNNLTTEYPHGGIAAGETRGTRVRLRSKYSEVPLEEYGEETGEILWLGCSLKIATFLRGFDAETVARVFPNTTGAGVTGAERIIEHPGSGATPLRAGSLLSTIALPVLFSPYDVDGTCVLLYRAIPVLEPESEYDPDPEEPQEILVGFVPIRHASTGKAWQIGRRERLTL